MALADFRNILKSNEKKNGTKTDKGRQACNLTSHNAQKLNAGAADKGCFEVFLFLFCHRNAIEVSRVKPIVLELCEQCCDFTPLP